MLLFKRDKWVFAVVPFPLDKHIWYNYWRPHMTLNGLCPDDVYYDNKPNKPERDAKTVPDDIEQHYFCQTRTTGYRLRKVA